MKIIIESAKRVSRHERKEDDKRMFRAHFGTVFQQEFTIVVVSYSKRLFDGENGISLNLFPDLYT